MKAILIIEGKEFDIEINNPELQKLLKPEKKTGYERVGKGGIHYYDEGLRVAEDKDYYEFLDNEFYNGANYYSDKTVAENNTRANKLMRQLRRFAVEHRENEPDWLADTCKYVIKYSYLTERPYVTYETNCRSFGGIFFDSEEVANNAIMFYCDELIWYFTEYKDSL